MKEWHHSLGLDDASLSIAKFLHRNNHIIFHIRVTSHVVRQISRCISISVSGSHPKAKLWSTTLHLLLLFQVLLFHRASPGLLCNLLLRAEYNREELWGPSALSKKVAILQLLSMEPFQFLQSPRQAQLYNLERCSRTLTHFHNSKHQQHGLPSDHVHKHRNLQLSCWYSLQLRQFISQWFSSSHLELLFSRSTQTTGTRLLIMAGLQTLNL